MIINHIYEHDEWCIHPMNIKLLSLNEENQNFEYKSRRQNVFGGPKRGGATIRGNTIILKYF